MLMRVILLGVIVGAPLFGIIGDAYAAAGRRANHAAGPGHCGEHMYWQQGRCIDATDRPRDMTWDNYILKYGTWKQ
jgi:hypothetical protein